MAITMTEEIYGTHASYDLAVSVKTQRIIFRCKNKACKHVWAKDYRKVFQVMPETIWPRQGGRSYRIEAVYKMVRLENGKAIQYEEDVHCPACGRHGESNKVVGTTTEKKCDSRCTGATKGVCECSCGGKNHGAGHL